MWTQQPLAEKKKEMSLRRCILRCFDKTRHPPQTNMAMNCLQQASHNPNSPAIQHFKSLLNYNKLIPLSSTEFGTVFFLFVEFEITKLQFRKGNKKSLNYKMHSFQTELLFFQLVLSNLILFYQKCWGKIFLFVVLPAKGCAKDERF